MTLSTSSSRAVRTSTGVLAPAARSRRRTSKPSMPGQPHVEHDEVRRLVRRDVEALLAGARDRDLVALLLEGVLDAARDGVLVFDDQDGGGHAAMLHRARAGWRARVGATPWYPSATLPGASPSGPAGEPQPAPTTTTIQRFRTMPTARATLAAEHREVTGKKVARLRRAGTPARPSSTATASTSTSVTVDAHEFEQLRRHSRPERPGRPVGRRRRRRSPVLVYGVQVHPVNRRPLHVDLFVVRMTEELTVDVPLVATGESPAVDAPGRHAPPPDRVRPRPRAARSPAAVDRVLGRVARRLRHHDPRPRPDDPRRRDAADRRRRDHRQGPGAARRGGVVVAGRGRRGRRKARRPPRARAPQAGRGRSTESRRGLTLGRGADAARARSRSARRRPRREDDREAHRQLVRLQRGQPSPQRREQPLAQRPARARRTASPRRTRRGTRGSRRP